MTVNFRGTDRCIYGSDRHTIVMDDDLTDLDDTATHQARRDGITLTDAVCDFHADWLRERGGWTITPIEAAA